MGFPMFAGQHLGVMHSAALLPSAQGPRLSSVPIHQLDFLDFVSLPNDPIGDVSFAAHGSPAASLAVLPCNNTSNIPISSPSLFTSLGFAVSSDVIDTILPDSPHEMMKNIHQVQVHQPACVL
jgi:hypothetical protein